MYKMWDIDVNQCKFQAPPLIEVDWLCILVDTW